MVAAELNRRHTYQCAYRCASLSRPTQPKALHNSKSLAVAVAMTSQGRDGTFTSRCLAQHARHTDHSSHAESEPLPGVAARGVEVGRANRVKVQLPVCARVHAAPILRRSQCRMRRTRCVPCCCGATHCSCVYERRTAWLLYAYCSLFAGRPTFCPLSSLPALATAGLRPRAARDVRTSPAGARTPRPGASSATRPCAC